MKTKQIDLNVDVIGEQSPLTDEEQKAISAFIQQQKALSPKPNHKKPKAGKKQKATV